MTTGKLRYGYTTGACAAAAAKGAALLLARQEPATDVTLPLPAGVSATFPLHGQSFSPGEASCYVVKDAGDDPDVTNGCEVHARVTVTPPPSTGGGWGVGESATCPSLGNVPPTLTLPRQGGGDIIITGGAGIGRVTKPGLAVPPGQWAINPVPRRMIEDAVLSVFPDDATQQVQFTIEISIPDGEERAKKTLNARLGIMGGLSILGTTGIVRPLSAQAWTDTIDAALDVARACGCPTVVLSTGRTSELAAQRWMSENIPPPLTGGGQGVGDVATRDGYGNFPPTLTLPRLGGGDRSFPEEAFVMMGDHVAYALRACAERGFRQPVIACQFAKLLKIACGHGNTHAAASDLDLAHLRQWAKAEKLPPGIIAAIGQANTAREVIIASGFDRRLLELVCNRAQKAVASTVPSLRVIFQVADYAGTIVFQSP